MAHIKFIAFYIGIFPQKSLNTDGSQTQSFLRTSANHPSSAKPQFALSVIGLYATEYCQHSLCKQSSEVIANENISP